MKVRERAFGWQQLRQMPDLAHLAPRNAGAAHAGVDGEMPRAAASATPCLDLGRESKRRSQSRGSGSRKLLLEQWGEHHDRTCNAEVAKLFALRDGGYPVPPRFQNIECPQCRGGTQPIGVRLDHRQKRNACAPCDRRSITLQRAKIDLDPGAS